MDSVDSSQPKVVPDWPWVVNRVHDQLPQDGIRTAFPLEIQHRKQAKTNGDLNVDRRWLATWLKPVGTYGVLIWNGFVVKMTSKYTYQATSGYFGLTFDRRIGKFSPHCRSGVWKVPSFNISTVTGWTILKYTKIASFKILPIHNSWSPSHAIQHHVRNVAGELLLKKLK